jgi:hypothetical protein
MKSLFPTSVSRVRIHTSSKSNDRIYDEMRRNIAKYINASKDDISQRIEQLNKEWDTERVLEANASAIILIGAVLGFLVNTWLFLICGFISFYLLVHALEGWCPPLPLIRRLGVRTVYEICTEKMILKHLRGDFDDLPESAASLVKAAKTESKKNAVFHSGRI